MTNLYVWGGAVAIVGAAVWWSWREEAPPTPAKAIAPDAPRLPTAESVRPPRTPPQLAASMAEVLPAPPIPPPVLLTPPVVATQQVRAVVPKAAVLRDEAPVFAPPPPAAPPAVAPTVFNPVPVGKPSPTVYGGKVGGSFEWLGGGGPAEF